MRHVTGSSWAYAYERLLREVMDEPDHEVGPRGQATLEIEDLFVEVPLMDSGVFANEERGTDLRYLAGELLWYLTGRDDTGFIRRYSSFWDKISVGGKANSAYGALLFRPRFDPEDDAPSGPASITGPSEWAWALRSLVKDPDTRQAVMVLNRPRHHWTGNPDQVCTMTIGFMLRDGQLDVRTVMRSSDVWFGLPFDAPFFMLLGKMMMRHLRYAGISVSHGHWRHHAFSTHAYARDHDKIRRMLAEPFHAYPVPMLDIDPVDRLGKAHPGVREAAWMTERNDTATWGSDGASNTVLTRFDQRWDSSWLSWLVRCALAPKKTEAHPQETEA